MDQSIRLNNKAQPWLDEELLDALFESVYSSQGRYARETEEFLSRHTEQLKAWFDLLKGHQDYNYWYRQEQCAALYPLACRVVGPFEIDSEGTTFWLALILAIQETYGMSGQTLVSVLQLIRVRK